MELKQLPIPYQLTYGISNFLFKSSVLKCTVLISKTPYLSALIACHGAKVKVKPPYQPGTCMLFPLNNPDILKHVVIDRFEEFNGQMFYYFKYAKKQVNRKKKLNSIDSDIGKKGKPSSFVEKYGIHFPFKSEEEWLGKHDISNVELEQITNENFPAIIGQKNLVEYWKNKALNLISNPDYTMGDILNIAKKESKFDKLSIFSTRSEKRKNHINQIWINSIPESISNGKFLIILSPSHVVVN
ncbi:hypothetical protein I6F43_10240 [Pseudoalteromonas sp. NZS71_1]|uniref:hypothetical protein n=1 Tax=Pseudoalteromonas sp. NZS71_1 TaxID=2792072 RepID=UPI0018CFDC10|nr:hypothetical protein [Pseudoalteromonas sp. NZS71_1]MBH0035052.1 hypothetical protein [Pseudoalteromonas sp. NZS71_1]